MKYLKLSLCIMLVGLLSVAFLTGCSTPGAKTTDESVKETADEPAKETNEAEEAEKEPAEDAAASTTSLDENGFWEGITALDYVTLLDYKAISVPGETHKISDEDVQNEIDFIISSYTTSSEITDRAVEDGDTVNIDYVGSVDGVEFDGGSTGGAGTEVTIGVTEYIDGFLEQLVGHEPGETFDINVTFPEEYGSEELNGKDAVFNITINHIVETEEPELTDEFVAENLTEFYDWKTVDEMKEGTYETLQNNAVRSFMQEHMVSNSTIDSVPDQLIEYLENEMVEYYTESAEAYEMELEEFLNTYVGASSLEEVIENYRESNEDTANYYLVVQAIAEDADISVDDKDVENYFMENFGSEDFAEYEEQYGMPYLKQAVLCQKVLDYLIENAVLA